MKVFERIGAKEEKKYFILYIKFQGETHKYYYSQVEPTGFTEIANFASLLTKDECSNLKLEVEKNLRAQVDELEYHSRLFANILGAYGHYQSDKRKLRDPASFSIPGGARTPEVSSELHKKGL